MREAIPRRYPTDLSDAEWAALEPLLPPPASKGRPFKWPRRLMAEAIFYLVRSGCAWRMLPRCFPPWPTVFAHFRRWRLDGTLRRMHDRLRALAREAEGRQPEPSAAIIDRSGVAASVALRAATTPRSGLQAASGTSSSMPPASSSSPMSTQPTCTIGSAPRPSSAKLVPPSFRAWS